MANFSYKVTTTTAMKVAGTIDTDCMTIDIDGEPKKLSTLLSDFNGTDIEINITNLRMRKTLSDRKLVPL